MFVVLDPELQPPFALTIARNGSHTVVSLQGELDIASEGELAAGLGLVLIPPTRVLTMDLRELSFLDSTGLRALLELRTRCETHGCRLLLIPGGPTVRRAFDVSGLTAHFTIVDPSEAPSAVQPAG
jgi:anti-anti-sigma factor